MTHGIQENYYIDGYDFIVEGYSLKSAKKARCDSLYLSSQLL
jgi:hypothetical protein